jgi:hypothetical protein
MLLLKFYKKFYILICLLLFRCLFSVNILVVVNTIVLFISRTLSSSLGSPIFLYTLPRVVTRLIARFCLSR